MTHEHRQGPQDEHGPKNEHGNGTLSKSTLVLVGFLIIAGYFLFTEHRAHVIAFLPYALLLACPLMHIFMHGGHGGHRHGGRSDDKQGDA